MKGLIMLTLVLLLLPVSTQCQEIKTCLAFPVKEKIFLDGRLQEPIWEKLPKCSDFYILGSEARSYKKTSFKAGYTKEALYLGVWCEQPEAYKIEAKYKRNCLVDLCSDNSIEIFIFPKEAKTYLQFVSNIESYQLNLKDGDIESSFNLWNWQAKAYKGNNFWSLEVKIPFEVLERFPKEGEIWRINIGRDDITLSTASASIGGRFTSWAYIPTGGFHNPPNFGYLIFGGKLWTKEAGDRRIVAFLLKERLYPVLESGFRLVREISKKRKSKVQNKEFSALKEQLQRIKKKFRSKKASIKEVDSLIIEAEQVLKKLQELEVELIKQELFNITMGKASWNDGAYFKGPADEVKIHNRALSEEEAYKSRKQIPCALGLEKGKRQDKITFASKKATIVQPEAEIYVALADHGFYDWTDSYTHHSAPSHQIKR